MPEVDWCEMFRHYVAIVRRQEGVDFLYSPAEGYDDWTAEEWAAIRALVDGSDAAMKMEPVEPGSTAWSMGATHSGILPDPARNSNPPEIGSTLPRYDGTGETK